MKIIVIRILGGLFFAGMITALFLPFFESFTEAIIHRPLSIISERPNPHQGGHFGGGFYTTYNGFGSVIALFNIGIALFLFNMLFLTPSKRMVVKVFLTFFLLSHALIFLGMIAAPFVLSPPDKMLSGYFVFTASEIGLFRVVYWLVKRRESVRVSNSDILDEGID